MSGVNYTFNLGPISDSVVRDPRAASTNNHSTLEASYQNAQGYSAKPASDLNGVSSPACDGSSCFIVHGEGPGVTTLSIGEEEGAGDYLSRPVVDGTSFLEPPADNFASSGPSDVTTLAIGEEDGGYVSDSYQIGESYSSPDMMSVQPMYEETTMQPVYSSVDIMDVTAPSVVTSTPAVSAGPAIADFQTLPPREKPISFALGESPLPGAKPISEMAVSSTPIASAPVTSEANYVSVGDYDSYISGVETSSSSSSTTAYEAQAEPDTPSAETATSNSEIVGYPTELELNFGTPRASTFSIQAPLPDSKPEIDTSSPRLSDEDLRITTLALGEEEAGGG